MGTIRVEYVPIQRFGLGLFGLDHIQLVYQDETDVIDSQDYWFVLEGIQDGSIFGGTLGALGEDGTTSLSVANLASRDELVAKIGTPETRGSRILTTGPDAANLWASMAHYAAGIQDMQLPYIGASWPFGPQPTINSTSFVSTLLWSIGIDVNNLMPIGIRNSPGASTLIGTADSDVIQIGGSFTQLVTGPGDDVLAGSNNLIFVEKFFGGEGDDRIHWSLGENVINGGQPRMPYAVDGQDTVDYSGVGTVHIYANAHPVEHKVATYNAVFDGGTDQLFSIERVAYNKDSDHVIAGEGVDLIEVPLMLDLKESDSGGRGDVLGMTGTNSALIFNAVSSSMMSVQTVANSGEDAGYWAQSVEWLEGSNGNDLIYTNASVFGAEAGTGDDLIDGRLADAFSGRSPQGYDIELDGGAGRDTLVSGSGRTLATGGSGSDTFVLSSMTSDFGTVEFVIADADAQDQLVVPYDFFRVDRGDFDGSQLFQLSGAPFKIDSIITESFFQSGLTMTIRFRATSSSSAIYPTKWKVTI